MLHVSLTIAYVKVLYVYSCQTTKIRDKHAPHCDFNRIDEAYDHRHRYYITIYIYIYPIIHGYDHDKNLYVAYDLMVHALTAFVFVLQMIGLHTINIT